MASVFESPMQILKYNHPSVHTGRSMPVLRYGSAGAALIYVPSSGGDQHEFGRYGLHEVCAPWLDAGKVQVFSIDGCGPTTLFDPELAPRERIGRYAAFERYVSEELLPWIASVAPGCEIGAIGASYGAFVAANLLFKRYEQVRIACGLGGVYQMGHRIDGYHDDDVYYHTPLEYLPRLEDSAILEAIRATRGMVLFGAEADHWLPTTHQLAHVLREKQLPHEIEIWPAPADHNEFWWRKQLAVFLERYYS